MAPRKPKKSIEIVETVHKGRLFADSEVGKGSCFGFELELAA